MGPTRKPKDARRWLERQWQADTLGSRLLLPLAAAYCAISTFNRYLYARGWRRAQPIAVPVIVVGNITVGGTGKTPLVMWIARYLKEAGWRPGVVTRGYGGRSDTWPQAVTADSDAMLVGDEPVMLAARSGVPVVADPDRPRGARELVAQGCNVIVSDDGMQHYRLRRDLEIAVVDGERGFGNGRCLPAGPLRELPSRLEQVDATVFHGAAKTGAWSMTLTPVSIRRVQTGQESIPMSAWKGRRVHAVAGIGHPARFFTLLRRLGLDVIEHAFADHHRFRPEDFYFADTHGVIMTEKDAVKCRSFATASMWYLAVEAKLDAGFGEWLLERLGKRSHG